FVAATTRTSTLISLLLPSLVNCASCRTCSSLAWSAAFISPISSRKIVPVSACSNLPMRVMAAPVNAPSSWPNSSLSRSSAGGGERDFAKAVGIIRLDDVVGDAEADRLGNRGHLIPTELHDLLQVAPCGFQRPDRLDASHACHHHVEKHNVGRVTLLDGGDHL